MTDSTNKEELSSLPSQDGEMPLSDDPVVLSALFRSLVTESLKTTIEKEADLLQNEILLVTPVRKVNVGIRKRWLEQAVTKHRLTISPWPPWTDVAQRCRFMVENAYITPELRKKIRFIVASEPSIIVNGELHACSSTLFGSSASPPEKEAEIAQEKQRYFDYICRRLIGTGQQHEIEMEVVSGIAAYDLTTSQGVMAELRFPFTIRPFRSREEVETYLRVLCRLTFKGMSLDTEYIGSSNLLVPREFNQAIAASVSEGNILEEEIPIGGDWLHEKLSIKEEVKMGLHISQEFPGGIYLGALVASGAVTSIDGIRLNVLPADDLGRFTLVSRGVHVEGVALLLLALRGEAEEKLGVTYRHNNWQHLIFPKSYTPINTFEYYLTEKELLEAEQKREDHSRSSIWDNPNLPPPR